MPIEYLMNNTQYNILFPKKKKKKKKKKIKKKKKKKKKKKIGSNHTRFDMTK